ncbi:hypothetical protein BaRGS_00005129 [Batillaria attramentaria]|uniref:Uncharacterized protein n=1 Tax=Batillaria attramentaria TaxID=370345 RepID=A0ABD0LVR9_9CAEN
MRNSKHGGEVRNLGSPNTDRTFYGARRKEDQRQAPGIPTTPSRPLGICLLRTEVQQLLDTGEEVQDLSVLGTHIADWLANLSP